MNIIEILAKELEGRLEALSMRKDVSEMKGVVDPLDVIETASSYVVLGIRRESTMTQVVSSIGTRIRDKMGKKRDSTIATKVGAFILESYERVKIIQKIEETNGRHTIYTLKCVNENKLAKLWELIPHEKSEHLPQIVEPAPWASGIHSTGVPIIRHAPKSVLNTITPSTHNEIYRALNKNNSTAWKLDSQMVDWYVNAFNKSKFAMLIDKTGTYYAFDFLDPSEKAKARSSLRLEANSIRAIARKIGNQSFYHLYNLDFRGRIYPTSAFLHEQGSDKAKGLLRLSEDEPFGEWGWWWFQVYTTNNFGNDKIPLADRVTFCSDKLDEWISFAEDPFVNKGWMKADKPWTFLSCCLELLRISEFLEMEMGELSDYRCNLPLYIDGSNNGVQHLTALSLDDVVAPLVNLVPRDIPGDVYMYVADKAWDIVEKDYDPLLDSDYKDAYKQLIKSKKRFDKGNMKKSERNQLIADIRALRDTVRPIISKSAPNYWMEVKSKKLRRKVTKRPCMTLGYGGTKYGFKNQIMEDTKSSSGHFRHMEFPWAGYMGTLIYDICRGNKKKGMEASLPGPAIMLELFGELAVRSTKKGGKFKWTVPFTNFPVVQQYRTPTTKRVRLDYMDEEIRLSIRIMEKQKVNEGKQKTAAAPNIVHSFDAAHLTMTINACDFPTATVHDSFGCNAGNMDDMFYEVREQFVRFYKADPLVTLLTEQDSMDLMPIRGKLNITDILQSDFAFV